MKRIAFALLAALAACTQQAETPPAPPAALTEQTLPISDGAGNTMEALARNGENAWCSADGVWCVMSPHEAAPLDASVMHTRNGDAHSPLQVTFAEGYDYAVWPIIIRMPRTDGQDEAIIGITRTENQMYSGGGGQATEVLMFRVWSGPTDTSTDLLTAPLSANLSIRACFDEEDQRHRAGACSDEYTFAAEYVLDTTVTSGAPRLLVTTQATSYPGVRDRNSDSTTQDPLTEDDLVVATDPVCSYTRVLTRHEGDGTYGYDTPPPACENYLKP